MIEWVAWRALPSAIPRHGAVRWTTTPSSGQRSRFSEGAHAEGSLRPRFTPETVDSSRMKLRKFFAATLVAAFSFWSGRRAAIHVPRRIPAKRTSATSGSSPSAVENAEAYFSADGSGSRFQSTPRMACDQQYVMRIDGPACARISNGHGKTTCGWFLPGTAGSSLLRRTRMTRPVRHARIRPTDMCGDSTVSTSTPSIATGRTCGA